MPETHTRPDYLSRRRVSLTGSIQGVGFRPFVYRLAREQRLTGWVKNTSLGVELEVEGPEAAVTSFLHRLIEEAPPLARPEVVEVLEIPPLKENGFHIQKSEDRDRSLMVTPPDVGHCRECAREIRDPRDRRHLYPFTTCTDCGPRFTVIRQVPYDRSRTTMAVFTMCPDCRREYEDPGDRRFHAEIIACPACGPRVWLEYEGERRSEAALEAAARLLHEGKILAVKGLGGFHLAADARNDQAVQDLRRRKGRPDKPFALMVRDLEEAARIAVLGDLERRLLSSPERPIVLCRKQPGSGISPSVAPGNGFLGLMLPYSPLHLLLLDLAPPALVMTSGNVSEAPLVFTNEEAREKLASLAHAFLLHNRDIQVPCDDSVLRPLADGKVVLFRRGRGLVPQPLSLPLEAPELLALGGDQKNTFCLAWSHTALMSQHLGDLDTLEGLRYWETVLRHFQHLSRKSPKILVHDLHPGYFTTRYALEKRGVRLVGVQHHHAHVAACLAEHSHSGPCIGLALDGTGYGPEGGLWGGEILVADLAHFTRAGHLAPVRLPGGEAAVKNPSRMAASYLYAAFGENFLELAARLGLNFSDLEQRLLHRQLTTGWQAPLTTSAGRLFDAVAAVTGICRRRTYEGQPALELEMAAAPGEEKFYAAGIKHCGQAVVLDTLAIFRGVVTDLLAGVDKERLAARFHLSLVEGLARMCETLRQRTGLNVVALSGGVFQNGLLLTRLKDRLAQAKFQVLWPQRVPPNDGGLSLGQAAVAAAQLGRT